MNRLPRKAFAFASILVSMLPLLPVLLLVMIREVPWSQLYLMFPHCKRKVHSLAPTMSTMVSGDYSSYLATYYYREAHNTFHEMQTQARSSSDNHHTFARKPILTKGLSASASHHGSKGHFLVNSSHPASMPNVYSLAPPSPDVGNSRLDAFLKPYGVSVTGMGGT